MLWTVKLQNHVEDAIITYKKNEFKTAQKKNPIYREFSLRLQSGDLVDFENDEDDVAVILKIKRQ